MPTMSDDANFAVTISVSPENKSLWAKLQQDDSSYLLRAFISISLIPKSIPIDNRLPEKSLGIIKTKPIEIINFLIDSPNKPYNNSYDNIMSTIYLFLPNNQFVSVFKYKILKEIFRQLYQLLYNYTQEQ